VCLSCAIPRAAHGQDAPTESPARGAPSDEARAAASAHFQRGVQLHEEGDYDAALVEFQRAYDAMPDYRVLYNVGVTYLAQRSYVLSLRAFERYLVLGGSTLDPARRAEVEERIANLRQRVGFLVLEVNVTDAEVLVDGEVVARTPVPSPLSLDVGRHRVEVRAAGHMPEQRTISVAGGDELELAIELEPVAAPVASVPPPPAPDLTTPEPPHRNLRPLAIGGFISTAVLAAAAGTTGGLALRSHRDYEDAAGTYPGDAQALSDARSRTHTLSIVTDALGATAIALGVTSLVVILVDRSHRRGDDEGDEENLELSFGPLGASLRARF
jgi:hypothetical protein